MESRLKKLVCMVPLAIVGMLVFSFIGGQIVLHLWNWIVPPLFGWPEIGFWQALGLLVLCRILFGGFGMHSGSRRCRRRHIDENWQFLSPEERERFRQRMRERWGFDPATRETRQL